MRVDIMTMWRTVIGGVVCSLLAGCMHRSVTEQDKAHAANPVTVDVDVSAVMGPGWYGQRFPGKRVTGYSVSAMEGVAAVLANANASASMLRRRVDIPPEALSRVQFSWWVPRLIDKARLPDPQLDDAPVRVMLAFDGDHSKLSARHRMMSELAQLMTGEPMPYATLVYVWDGDSPLETVIPGARTDRIRKIVVDSGPSHLRTWRLHERNIAEDFQKAFGEAPGRLVGLAVMSDTDNTASHIQSYYGPVRLSGEAGSVRVGTMSGEATAEDAVPGGADVAAAGPGTAAGKTKGPF